MEELIIRKPTPGDVEQVQKIYTCIQKKSVQSDLETRLEDGFVAEVDGKVVGFVIGYNLSSGFGLAKSAWLAMVGVDPNYMGEKIGKQLAEKALSYYKEQGYESVHLSVRWDATDLLSFFKTIGFDRSEFINLEKRLVDE
jgi:ribosomal protein S18 acetylase RimI-like enzyme